MPWLLSYQVQPVFLMPVGFRRNEPFDELHVIEEHPALFVANNRADYHAMGKADYDPNRPGGPWRVDLVIRIYSAIEIPGDALGMPDMDNLRLD